MPLWKIFLVGLFVTFTVTSFIPGLAMTLTGATGTGQLVATVAFGLGIGVSTANLALRFANAKSR